MKILIDILGWIATFLILISYYLNTKNRLKADSVPSLLCNSIGGLFFVINTSYYGVYSSTILNVFWMGIAFAGLFRK